LGWTYWLGWVLVGIADLSAVINYLSFWLPDGASFSPIQQAMISAGCVLFVMGLNLLTVRLFGEIEFWFALIKILAIIGLIGVGGYMIFSHFQAPQGAVASISNVWSHGGLFPKGTEGFLAGFQIAVFAFVGLSWLVRQLLKRKTRRRTYRKQLTRFRYVLFCSMYWRYLL